MSSCKSKPKDADIQASISNNLRDNAATNAGTVSVSVNDGVVTLTGDCPDTFCKTAAEHAANEVEGVKQVVNNIAVTPMQAPVEITADEPLKAAVNDVIKDYSGVRATVNDGVVTLEGSMQRSDLQNLMMQLNNLHPRKIENNLTLK